MTAAKERLTCKTFRDSKCARLLSGFIPHVLSACATATALISKYSQSNQQQSTKRDTTLYPFNRLTFPSMSLQKATSGSSLSRLLENAPFALNHSAAKTW